MCGICGVAALVGGLDPAIRSALPSMTRMLEHRGPDGEGFFSDNYAAMGHRRLAIIDRTGGSQPISNEDGSCWIVFNGEIYNHVALRRELIARGHTFRTTCDTEAIVHAYEEFGTGSVEHLEGMFAFAIYDQRRREVFLARDRIGKKPLFYALLDGTFHFASEIKAFYASPAWDDDLDKSSLESYLSLGYVLAPHTVYRHVCKLEPGHWLRLRSDHLEVRKYWDIERFGNDRRDSATLESVVESTLGAAVRERLESEVPLGAFLSGGIDSGLIVSFMADTIGEELVTTSVGFDDPVHTELAAARLTAGRFRTNHYEHLAEPKLEDVLDRIVDAFDEPFADSSAIPTYYVSSIARQHVTVALTGDGGDETFGGYGFRYVPHALECRVRSFVPGRAGRVAAAWLGARWPQSPRLLRFLRLKTIFENLSQSPELAYGADLCFMKPVQVRELMGGGPRSDPFDSPVYAAVTEPYRRCPSPDPILRAQYADLKVYLPNDVLVKVDRMSMAHSLEIRCPLLDRRMVELAFAIPTSAKMPGLRPKYLLKRVARQRLPAKVLRLPKHGFTAPVGRWIAGPYATAFQDEVLQQNSAVGSLVERTMVARLFEEHRAGRADHSYALWAIWMLERWARLRRSHGLAAQASVLRSTRPVGVNTPAAARPTTYAGR